MRLSDFGVALASAGIVACLSSPEVDVATLAGMQNTGSCDHGL